MILALLILVGSVLAYLARRKRSQDAEFFASVAFFAGCVVLLLGAA